MPRSRWILAVLVVLSLGGAWLVFEGSGRSERAIVEGIVEEEEPPEPVPTPPIQLEPIEGEEAESGRISVEDDELDGTTPPAATQDAHFSVQVAALETSAPLPDILVVLRRSKASVRLFATASRGPAGETLKTDARGQVEYAVPPGHDYVLTVAVGDERRAAELVQDVPAFEPGERRDLVVRLVTASDLVWFGRALDGETNLPIAGARVWRLTGRPFADVHGPAATTDASGLVQLDSASWVASFARVEQPGYAPGFVLIEPGHENPDAACSVVLYRASELEVIVSGAAAAPREDLAVVLTCWAGDLVQGSPWTADLSESPSWKGPTDAEGRCVLGELPARVPLTLELIDGSDLVLREERSIRLEPGERKELRYALGSGCRVQGRTLDPEGRPQAGVEVWLVSGGSSLYLQDQDVNGLVSKAMSDDQGIFALEDIGAGRWRIGPAPRTRARHDPQAIAPVAQELVIAPEQALERVSLTCWSGLYIDGRVVGPNGEKVHDGFVSAIGEGLRVLGVLSGDEFLLGPLPSGSFEVRAWTLSGAFADSEAVTAPAGTSDLVLRMRRGASIAITVHDSRGKPVAGSMVFVLDEAAPGRVFGRFTDEQGRVDAARLPGSYTISASSRDGEFGFVCGVQVPPSGDPTPVELRLEPAARLKIRILPETPKEAGIQILQGTRPISFGLLAGDPIAVVPEGEIELVLSHGTPPQELQRRTVHAVRDAETEVVFDLTPR